MGLPHSFYYYFLHFPTLSSSTIVFSIWLNFFLFHYVPVAAVVLFNPPRSIHPSIQQDYHTSIHRDSFSGSGLSSPALQRSHRDSFSESPSGQLNKKSVTDSKREVRIARGQRPGIVYPLPRAARPDARLAIDAALPEAAALHRVERPPTVVDIPEPGQLEETCCPESSHRRGSRSPRRHSRKRPRNRSSGVFRPKKRSPHRGHWCE